TGGGGGGGAGGLAGGGAGTVGGFVGLLQTLQEYRNAEDSFELQKRSLAELEANLAGDKIDLVQVDQFRQSIETQRAQLLQSGINLENSIESYLTGTLGLPPDLPVALDDAFIRPFQLVTPGITRIQARFNLIQDEIGALPTEITPEQLAPILDALDAGRLELEAYLKVVEEDFATLEAKLPERTARMTPAEINALQNDLGKVGDKFDELVGLIAAAPPRLAAIRQELGSRPVDESLSDTLTWMRDFQQLVQAVSLLQARVRLEAVTIDPLELDPVTALTIARANRPDLMNNRANLVDSWRLIAFNANALLSDLDVTFSGDLSSVGQNPAQFRGPTGHLSAGLQLDGPFTRLLERNNYRQSLIDYQQSRRQYIQFEDSLNLSTRQTLRQLEQLRTNLEIQRRAVTISIQRVDLTQSDLNRPIAPDEPRGDTVVQNLLSALNDLRNTQNNFMSVWLNYYATRMVLMRDLGVMELDDEGRWIDRPIDWSAWMPTEAIEMPPSIPREWMEQAFPEGIPPLAPTDDSEQGEPAELIEPSQSYRPQLERLADRREPLYRPLPVEPEAPRAASEPRRTERRR
ncbi:MAG TPA: TolC family protein, partial [Pirellulaceae bacterium]|nr:TolC family protein [Pirellulaceae bacterium]